MSELPWWAERLREIRHEQGRTLEDVGEKAGVSRHYLSALECGHHVPRIDTVRSIAKALGGDVLITGRRRRRSRPSIVSRFSPDQNADNNQ